MEPTLERIKECRRPQDALVLLAKEIDQMQLLMAALARQVHELEPPADPWQQPLMWSTADEGDVALKDNVFETDNRARIENGEVIVEPVSEERQQERELFAINNRLHEFTTLNVEDFSEAYVKGGPRWLYYTARDVVMSMPMDLRQQLVADVLLDSPSEAHEIGRDILKHVEGVDEGTQIDWQREARDLGPAYKGQG